MSTLQAEPELWDFSVRVYAQEGVAASCLWLQDRHAADVSLMLFCLWSGLRHGRLEAADLEAARASSEDWSRRVVGPLRAARRGLAECADLEGVDVDACLRLREEVQHQELVGERLQQERLQRGVAHLEPLDRATPAALAAARANLDDYLRAIGAGGAAVAAHTERILSASTR